MKKIAATFIIFLFSLGLGGCVSMPMKVYESLPKTNIVSLGQVSVFREMKLTTSGIKDIGKPTDDPYYQEVAREYSAVLEKELRENGFVVLTEPTPQSLVIKTKIGDQLPLLGGWMCGLGAVGAQVEVYQNEKLLLYFEEVVNTTNPKFLEGSVLGGRAKDQIRRHIAPRITKKLKEKFI